MSDTLIGYPGGKGSLKKKIQAALGKIDNGGEFRELFFGGGAIGIDTARKSGRDIWVNDLDPGIHAMWHCVATQPEKLKTLTKWFLPSREAFDKLRAFLLSSPVVASVDAMVTLAFAKIAIHKISFGSLGTMAGSSICQTAIDRRWSATSICKQIDKLHAVLKRTNIRITNGDFAALIEDQKPALLFLDPPYFARGGECYQHSFTMDDHVRLANTLQATRHPWVMTYDDCHSIGSLYAGWTDIEVIQAPYTLARPVMKTELLISSRA